MNDSSSKDLTKPLLAARRPSRKNTSRNHSFSEETEGGTTDLMRLLLKPNPLDGLVPGHPDFLEFRCRNLQWRLGMGEGTHREDLAKELWDAAPAGELPRCSSWPSMDRQPSQRELWMLSEGLESDLKKGFPRIWQRLQSHTGVALQLLVLVLVVFTYAACPLTVSWATVVDYDGSGHDAVPIKGRPFKESTVIVASWLLIAVVGLSLSFTLGGKPAVDQCLDKGQIMMFAPAGVGWALADVCEVLAVERIDPATYGVISQARLLGAAATGWALSGKRQTSLQWGVLASLSLVCMGYCIVPDDAIANKQRLLDWRLAQAELRINWYVNDHVVSEGEQGHSEYIAGLLLALGKVGLSVYGGVYAEMCFKLGKGDQPPPLHVQMTQVSFSSALTALLGHFVLCLLQGEDPFDFFSGPDGHWSFRTFVVAAVYCWREWICNICVKRFDALVKNICNAVALVVTYLFTVLVTGEKPFCLLKATLLMAAVVEVVNYVTTRRTVTSTPPLPPREEKADLEKSSSRKSSGTAH